MMNSRYILGLGGLALFAYSVLGADFPASATKAEERIPFLERRLHHPRWQIRYCLLSDLESRDSQTKRLLEMMIEDDHEKVAQQATVRYLNGFVNVDKDLFKPHLYVVPAESPLPHSMNENEKRALVDYCIGTGPYPFECQNTPPLQSLSSADVNNPEMVKTITIVGLLGKTADAPALYPFLESENDYVLLNTAKSLVRVGEKNKGVLALKHLEHISGHPVYVAEALSALKEIGGAECGTQADRIATETARRDTFSKRADHTKSSTAQFDTSIATPSLNELANRYSWQFRYHMRVKPQARDARTRQLLETLISHEDCGLSARALHDYVNLFTRINKGLFKPHLYLSSIHAPLPESMDAKDRRLLVDYCIGEIPYPFEVNSHPPIPPLNSEGVIDDMKIRAVTLIGVFGVPSDAPALYPFLQHSSDAVALAAARNLIRLGERERSVRFLEELSEEDVCARLLEIAEALYALKEIDAGDWRERARAIQGMIDSCHDIPPNELNHFFFLMFQAEEEGEL